MFGKNKKTAAAAAASAEAADRRDEALFRSLEKKKKKKRRKIIRTIIIILLLLAAGLFFGVSFLRRKVSTEFAASSDDYISYKATVGSISTTVSGSGSLSNVDEETVSVPSGVTVDEVVVSANDKVKKGDILAELDMASVMSAMGDLQAKLEGLDAQITNASIDKVNSYIPAGVAGRVKKIYARKGDDVLTCMYEHGALALLSLDGYMAVDIRTDTLSAGDSVRVIRGDGKNTEISGIVDTLTTGIAVILVTDNGPELDEPVTVLDAAGKELGKGKLYIHSALRVTGISGKISYANVEENMGVYAGNNIFYLTDTSFRADYEALIKERSEAEEDLLALMQLHKDGALLAPFDGSVSSVDYDDTASTDSAAATATADTDAGETSIVTLSPDKSMELSISVDESNILSLELGQTVQVTVSSISDETFNGSVTEINKTATSSSGVTRYSAVITLAKDERMLPGMSAKAVVRIQGVDNAVLIPVDALHQTSSTSYVYTSYDAEMKQPGGMVQVVAGISNSSYVEITEGLKEGDTVWYTEKTSIFNFGAMSFGGMPDGDFGGSGSGMPSGGFSGGSGSGRPSGGGMPGGGFSGGMPGGRG